jgi:hypothetical protein
MARGRMISKSLSTSRKFADLHRVAGDLGEFSQLLFPLIVAHTDDHGRMSADAFTVKFQVLPISSRPLEDFDTAVQHMHEVGLLHVYHVDGDKFLQVIDFEKHQTGLHKRTDSRIPEPPGNSGNFREFPGQEKRTEEKRREEKRTEPKGREGKGSRTLDETPQQRVREFMDYYSDAHQRIFKIAYFGSNNDYATALKLVATFTDQQLRDAAIVWFGMDDDFATNGTRTVPKFASRITRCLELMQQRGIA